MEKIRRINYGEFNLDHYPLIIFTSNSIDPTVADIKEYNETYLEVIAENEGRFVYLVDGTNAKWLSSAARIEMGKGQKIMEAQHIHRTNKVFIVVPNAIIRMMLKGVNVVSKTKVEQVIFSKLEPALEAAQKEVSLIN